MLLLILSGAASAQNVDAFPSFTADIITFQFDKPKGSVDFFEVNETLTFYNYDNESSAAITGLRVTVNNITGVSAVVTQDSLSVPPLQSREVNITFRANSTIDEGTYAGSISVSAQSGVTETSFNINVKIIHPPATINATWEYGWGNVRAGSNFTKVLVVGEVMGYKAAKNVSVSITHQGPAKLSYTSFLGDFSPFENKSMGVNVSIPARGLTPGSYPLTITISSPTNISTGFENTSYVIPTPQMVLSNTTIDLGRITFEAGKESSEKTLFVQEIGGYTPIEGLKITLVSGEVGWITYPEENYIPPGGTGKYTFRVFLPQDGTLGEKTWRYTLTTDYAGSKELLAKVLVYFPGIEEALSYLRGVEQIAEYPKSKDIITSTANLLEKSKGIVEAKKIVSVMSIYSGTRSFLSDINDAVKNHRFKRLAAAGDSIVRAHRSLTKMKVGEENLDDEELLSLTKDGVASAEDVWKSASEDILESLEREAAVARESNYKFAVLYYKRISQIYTLQGEQAKAEEYSALQREMEKLYSESLTLAAESRAYADREKEKALEKTLRIRDASFVINPLSYDAVSESLENAIANYEKAERLYRVAGETKDADLLAGKISELKAQRDAIETSFLIYGLFLTALFVGFLIRASLALQRYRLDEEDGTLGNIVMKSEED
jgi:hypothetical protein